MTFTEVVSNIFLLIGTLFLTLAGFGIFKFPDAYTRMAAGSKATTLGLIFSLVGILFDPIAQGFRLQIFLALLFVLFVAPVAAHLLGRSAYRAGVKPWKKTQRDDFKGSTD